MQEAIIASVSDDKMFKWAAWEIVIWAVQFVL